MDTWEKDELKNLNETSEASNETVNENITSCESVNENVNCCEPDKENLAGCQSATESVIDVPPQNNQGCAQESTVTEINNSSCATTNYNNNDTGYTNPNTYQQAVYTGGNPSQDTGYAGVNTSQNTGYKDPYNSGRFGQNSNASDNNSGNNNGNGTVNDNSGTTYYYGNGETSTGRKKERKPSPPVTRRTLVISLIICCICSSAIGAGGYMFMMSNFGGSTIDKSVNTTNYNLSLATGSELSIQEIIAKNTESVVAVTTESISTDSWMGQYVTQGAGSGVIYSEDGYIITNNHVIEGATKITVTLSNGSEYSANLIATDPTEDIAVIKIDAKGLKPVTIGKMSTASVGDLTVAIGNPLGTLSGTATSGIISALERDVTVSNVKMTLIQTDTAVNPGNSGGGLFDQYGNLIGLVVAKSAGSDVEGLGFAIPCDRVKEVVADLIETGHVSGRPAVGVNIVDLSSPERAMQYGVSITGVYISEVTGENATAAGLKAGDLIYYIDDTKVSGSDVLMAEIRSHNIGDTVTLTIVRNNEMSKIDVVLEDSATVGTVSDNAGKSDNSKN